MTTNFNHDIHVCMIVHVGDQKGLPQQVNYLKPLY